MRKLINGIVEFRRNVQNEYIEKFSRLAQGQKPDSLFIACSDSRVVPNTFASTDPGDLFVLRNVGNLIPPCGEHGVSISDESEAAAIEFAVLNLNVADIIVCGHSNCGAMQAILNDRSQVDPQNLKNWLRHGETALKRMHTGHGVESSESEVNRLSQTNVLVQMENIKTYPAVQERIRQGRLRIHGWWFDLSKADVYSYDKEQKRFVVIDESEAKRILSRLDS